MAFFLARISRVAKSASCSTARLGRRWFRRLGAALPATVAASARRQYRSGLRSVEAPAGFRFFQVSPTSALRSASRSRNYGVGASDSCRANLAPQGDARRPCCLRFDGDAPHGHVEEQADAGQHNQPVPHRLQAVLADGVSSRKTVAATGRLLQRPWRPRRRPCRRSCSRIFSSRARVAFHLGELRRIRDRHAGRTLSISSTTSLPSLRSSVAWTLRK